MRKSLILLVAVALAAMIAGCENGGMNAGESDAPEQYVYTVQGDEPGLYGVAQRVYGDGDMWMHIADANPDVDPSELEEGDELVIPVLQASEGDAITPMGCKRKAIY